MKGADHSYYSKMSPKKTWSQTFAGEAGAPIFSSGNIILMEISPWVPPGTTFLCRFRARFTNCDNCWHDKETLRTMTISIMNIVEVSLLKLSTLSFRL